jgi:subtilisin-like proprotein convertase family protein
VGTAGGGVASLASTCSASLKARGCTGGPTPQGDPFDIDFVAHEVGHQFGGQHTWAGTGGNCAGGNFAAGSAYEPGSGSTIMAYAGICGASQNLQMNSDAYFHRKSLDELGAFINGGGSCFTSGAVVNANEPTANAGADFIIPMGTPFELTGSGGDADGDPVTFNWEQFDLGLNKSLAIGDDGVQPIFRSWPSASSPTRVFPRLADLAAGTLSKGETLPVTNRTMNFKVTVRDNRAGGGREKDDAMTVTSTTAAGPFTLTAPSGGENFASGGSPTVTWNVASTAGGTVNTPNVDILMSADGGLTYPTTLVSNTPNDGSQSVTLPTNVSTTTGRIKVKGAGNVFFNISNGNFLLDALSQCRSPALVLADPGSVSDQMVIAGGRALADLNFKIDMAHTGVGHVTVALEHVDTATSVILIDRPGNPPDPDGCGNDNIVADLDDEAAIPAEGQCSVIPPAISGRFTPNNPLAAFDGQDVGGTWKLTVTDSTSGDSGTLNMWCLGASFEEAACPADLVLANQTLTGTQAYSATGTATLGPNLIVDGTDIAVNAPVVSILADTSISGPFSVGNSPACP